jgi:hypothetical protein
VKFGQTNILDITDNKGGWFDGSWIGTEVPTVGQYDLERAAEEAMLYYVQHIREKRYRAAVQHLETQVKEEEKRLAAVPNLSTDQRAEKLRIYREALLTALAEEVEENKDAFYVFNIKPSELPTYTDDKTFTEHLIEERFQRVYDAPDESSAREAKVGWRSPKGGEEMDIGRFAEGYIRPEFREQDGKYLRQNSPPRGEPFSFDELNTEMGATDNEFVEIFTQKIVPAHEVDAALRQKMDTEEELKSCMKKLGDKIDFHVKLHTHEGYYNTYLRRWRPCINMHVPQGSPLVKTLKAWRDKGYPRLIPQEFFGQWGSQAKNRGTEHQENRLSTLPENKQAGRKLQLHSNISLLDIPGLDLSKEGVRVYSYDGYWAEMYRISAQLAAARERDFGMEMLLGRQKHGQTQFFPIGKSTPWNQDRATPDPVLAWRKMQATKGRGRPIDLRPGENLESDGQMYIDASGKPCSLAEYALKKDVVAVTPQELEQMLQELGIFAYTPALPKLVIGPPQLPKPMEMLRPISDEFKPLREYLVRSHVLVLIDPMPMQPQLPIRLKQ